MFAIMRNPMPGLWEEMNRMERMFGFKEPEEKAWPVFPPVNVWEEEGNVFVEAELPGIEPEKFELYVTERNELEMKGEIPPLMEKRIFHRCERPTGKFHRVIELPVPVDAAKVEVRLERGILLAMLPKLEAAKPRRIEVKAG
jgi:HSP20 family protein